MATQIPLAPEYAGEIALRSNPETFDVNAEEQYTYLALFSTDWNVSIVAMNTAIGETQGYANSAATSASLAENSAGEAGSSAAISQSNANFAGKWSAQTGAKTVPYSVNDDVGDSNNYQLLEDIADITASQPSLNPAQWKLIITPALSEPDFKASFNDGLDIERGYGTVDANGNKVVDFTRASASGNINKSGVSVDLAVDEPGITSNGLSCYEEFSNYFINTELPVTQTPTITPGDFTLWITGNGSAVTSYGTATEGAPVTFSSLGEALLVTISGSVDFCNLIDLPKVAPPITSGAVTTTRAPDLPSTPMMNNMPAAGMPFTIVCDCAVPISGGEVNVFRVGTTQTSGFALRRIASGTLAFSLSNGTSFVNANYLPVDTEKHRIMAVFDGAAITVYVDGVAGDSATTTTAVYDLLADLNLGRHPSVGNYLNSEIKNLEIFHKALSAEEIAARGGPK